ncbi:uncharacterized protein LOC143449143 isoform X2 [Clavelina lepadiformis]|uniref:uncharacterized protein LOC143449143 isoform X2 n=1 Tax=Clavelina lepadiformis TaxID=159417 RepID=UPI0040412CAD
MSSSSNVVNLVSIPMLSLTPLDGTSTHQRDKYLEGHFTQPIVTGTDLAAKPALPSNLRSEVDTLSIVSEAAKRHLTKTCKIIIVIVVAILLIGAASCTLYFAIGTVKMYKLPTIQENRQLTSQILMQTITLEMTTCITTILDE